MGVRQSAGVWFLYTYVLRNIFISNIAVISDESEMSETVLKVGRKGEVFTTKELRRKARIKEGGKVRATVEEGKLIIEPIPSIEELLEKPLLSIRVKEVELLSEEAQKEEEIYG